MLNKENRLTTTHEFNVTRKYGQRISTVYAHMYFLKPQNYLGPTKVGFVISAKFDKRATVRNRVKRLYREAFRHNFGKIGKDYWIAVYPKSSSIGKTYETLSSDVNKALQSVFVA